MASKTHSELGNITPVSRVYSAAFARQKTIQTSVFTCCFNFFIYFWKKNQQSILRTEYINSAKNNDTVFLLPGHMRRDWRTGVRGWTGFGGLSGNILFFPTLLCAVGMHWGWQIWPWTSGEKAQIFFVFPFLVMPGDNWLVRHDILFLIVYIIFFQ